MSIKPIAINRDYDYPIYLYLEENLPETFAIKNELHVSFLNTNGYCNNILCVKCPLHHNCDNRSSLVEFFPELEEEYPELLI